ncbi:MAG TPA: M48 family metalloprotease [Terriglobia bacterium]|nr:M48 family metalloprotease [Terriglobia bacterium]
MTFQVAASALRKLALGLSLAGLALSPILARGVGKPDFKPGFNFYSPQQDAQLGEESSTQVDKQLPLLNEAEPLKYLNTLGKRLIAFAPNNYPDYAWQFRIVNSAEINAFALPGGYIYVNRGVFEAAEGEAQLAGVIAHESGHVVMRHGTHIASQAVLAQGGMAIVTSIFGQSNNPASQVLQLGLGLGVDSLLLKYSRTAETEADAVGTYILYQAGYDPHAMVQFFQIIAKKYPQRTLQFFSDHPNPENRIKDVDAEIAQLGPPRGTRTDSAEYEGAKQYLAALAPPPQKKGTPKIDAQKQPPPPPSANLIRYDGKMFTLDYPDNWQVERSEDSVTLFPPGGMVTGAEGETAQAYGAAVSLYTPQQGNWGLVDATQELVESMRQSIPQMHVLQQTGMNLQGNPAVSTLLQNDSPIEGQKETDHLVTVRQGDSILTFIFIAPVSAFESYAPTFDKILQSINVAH